jgi:hypothetical protein
MGFRSLISGTRAKFIYFGDRFINFMIGRSQGLDVVRCFGIAVDDKERTRSLFEGMAPCTGRNSFRAHQAPDEMGDLNGFRCAK